jgi:hypothetical protein
MALFWSGVGSKKVVCLATLRRHVAPGGNGGKKTPLAVVRENVKGLQQPTCTPTD